MSLVSFIYRVKSSAKRIKKLFIVFLLGLIASLPISIKGIASLVKAQTANEALLYITGPTDPGAGGSSYQLMVNSGTNHVGFAQIVLTFDTSKINLTSEIAINTSALNTNLSKTTMLQANSSGRITIESIFYPGEGQIAQNSPAGIFEVATLNFASVTTDLNIITSIDFDTPSMQLASSDFPGTEMQLAATNKDLLLNFSEPTATPTEIPSVTPTPTEDLTPTPTPTVELTPTITPTPTPSSSVATLTLVSQELVHPIDSEVVVDLNLSTNANILGVDAIVEYDPTVLSIGVDGVEANILLSGSNHIQVESGVVKISQTEDVDSVFTGAGKLATLRFIPLVLGSTTVSVRYIPDSRSDSNVIEDVLPRMDILVQPSDLALDIIAHPKATLNLTTESINVQSGHTTSGTLSTNDGNWTYNFQTDSSGTTSEFDIPAAYIGQSVTFYVKVPGYLIRKVVLSVNATSNIINTGLLSAGDINDDGIVNNIDLSLLYIDWFKIDSVANYDREGDVNSFDYIILRDNFFKENEI